MTNKQYDAFSNSSHIKIIFSLKPQLPNDAAFSFVQKNFSKKKKRVLQVPFPGPERFGNLAASDPVNTNFTSQLEDKMTKGYFQYRVREYFLFLLNTCHGYNTVKIHLSQSDMWTKEEEPRSRFCKNPVPEIPIRTFAAESGKSLKKLITGFKPQNQEGKYNFDLIARMEEARRLLDEGILPTKAVALEVGYIRTTNFITQFQKFFGFSPSEVQKMR